MANNASERNQMMDQISLYLAGETSIHPDYKDLFEKIAQRDPVLTRMFLLHMTIEEAHVFALLCDRKPYRSLGNSERRVFQALFKRWIEGFLHVNYVQCAVLLNRIIEECSPDQAPIIA